MLEAAVITKDRYLAQLLTLDLEDSGAVCVKLENNNNSDNFALVFYDVDSMPEEDMPPKSIPVGRSLAGTHKYRSYLPRPYTSEQLASVIKRMRAKRLLLYPDKNGVILDGALIRLTEYEYRLISEIYAANGEFVPREAILKNVWNESQNPGIVNVYIHYLRQKLEKSNERIIIASRSYGYCIDKKFIDEEV